MPSVIDLIRSATQRGARAAAPAGPPPGPYQGYVDERSTHHVAGWLRNLSDPAERCLFEIVLPMPEGDRVIHAGRADVFSDTLVKVGVGDGIYSFRVLFETPLSPAERDRLFVRPAGARAALEYAPALVTTPPGECAPVEETVAEVTVPARAARGPFQGYIDERSVAHVAGWLRNLSDPTERVAFEIVLPTPDGRERILHRGRADAFSNLLLTIGVGDGAHGFYVLLNEPLDDAERDRVFVRPAGEAHRLELAPELKTAFEPISHIAMDIVNNCNLRCPFCVYDYSNTRATKFMTDATFDAALRLIPYVTDGNFWLSCLHEATLHPRLMEFIARVPARYRRKLFYTTNLAKRMSLEYFAFLADSGMHHLNISVESFDPAIYERMREGARHRIFMENWEKLLTAFAAGRAPPRLRYNLMAYRSNLREIPGMIETLLRDKMAWQVEIRHTYDEPHIPPEFRDGEFLTTAEWAWLADALKDHSPETVVLLLPPGGVGYDGSETATRAPAGKPSAPKMTEPAGPEALPDEFISAPGGKYDRIPRPLNLSMDWDGTLRVYGEEPRGPGQPPTHVNYMMTNILYLRDPVRMLLAL
jgi:MoaA/NifB/PqqE/SkfB family radical SAM enzyme